jgi:polyisoprenoid-binding protein YceI
VIKNFAAKLAIIVSLISLLNMQKALAEQDVYLFDKMHTDILATWNHGGVSDLTAKFPKF